MIRAIKKCFIKHPQKRKLYQGKIENWGIVARKPIGFIINVLLKYTKVFFEGRVLRFLKTVSCEK
jgi:hypothetical protein